MNDPLRDNRIFPEEMQQKPVATKKTSHSNILWWFVGLVLLVLILMFLYNFYKKNTKQTIPENTAQTEFQRQENILKQAESANPGLNESQRQNKIKTFFEISE